MKKFLLLFLFTYKIALVKHFAVYIQFVIGNIVAFFFNNNAVKRLLRIERKGYIGRGIL